MTIEPATHPVLVIGAGIMGAGIAQVAAQAGHDVRLHDMRPHAAAQARDKLAATFDALVGKGKLPADQASATLARIRPVESLADGARGCGLVVEAIVENLEAKRALFKELETLVGPDCVLATNTSSISVTALANGLQRPGQLVGMHFFNPVPLMKLVEVVSGLHTDPAVAEAIYALSESWGKTPVHARSTPGFIVNRIARPYYAEALALLHERAAEPAQIDGCLKAAGFRMGPCELMDLIGHDTNFAVTNSVYEANFYDKRYQPSLVQRELVDGGLLGRKSGRGFYRYEGAAPAAPPAPAPDEPLPAGEAVVHGDDAIAETIAQVLLQRGCRVTRAAAGDSAGGWTGLAVGGARLVLTDGRPAWQLARDGGPEVVVFDRPCRLPAQGALAYALAPGAGDDWHRQARGWLAALGAAPMQVADTPGLVVARTIAMLINEAADAVQQGVCSEAGADAAMKLGVNYPAGPFEWLAGWSARGVAQVVAALDAAYRGERYRLSPWLRRLP
jgi:3-hydroxybutyryl-CoA dehydrogenase